MWLRRRRPLPKIEHEVSVIYPNVIEQAQRLVKRYGMRLERDGLDGWRVEGGRGSPYTGLPDEDIGLFCRYMIGVLAREDELIEKSGHGA